MVSEYQKKLNFPDMPLIDVGGPNKANLLPAELCDILPGQSFKGKLTDEHVASMITVAAKPPNINAASILQYGIESLGFRPGSSSQLGAFGISIGNEMAIVPGRILVPPRIQYGQGNPSVDDKASWNLKQVKFARGGTLQNWAVLVIIDGNQRDEFKGPNDPELMATLKGFADMCKSSGMNVPPGQPKIIGAQLPRKHGADPTRAAAINAIRTSIMTLKPKPTLLLVILSNGDKHIYSGLKHLCDTNLDLGMFFRPASSRLPTCCLSYCLRPLRQNSQRKRSVVLFSHPFESELHPTGQLQYFANVALKVNIKMGGVKCVFLLFVF